MSFLAFVSAICNHASAFLPNIFERAASLQMFQIEVPLFDLGTTPKEVYMQ